MKKVADRAVGVFGGVVGVRVSEHWIADRVLWMWVEVSGADVLSRGMQGFGVRIAKGVNAIAKTKGPVLADRYYLVTPVPKAWSDRADGVVRGAATILFKAAGAVKNEWMNPDEIASAVDRGPPLLGLGKAIGTFALAVVTARPRLSAMAGTGNKWERKRFHVKQENEHIRVWREDMRRQVAQSERTDEARHHRVTMRWMQWVRDEVAKGRDRAEVVAERNERERVEHEQIDDGTWRAPGKKRVRR